MPATGTVKLRSRAHPREAGLRIPPDDVTCGEADPMADHGASRRREHLRSVPTPGPDDPGALLRAVARGDEESFGRLYDLVAPRVYGLVRRVRAEPAKGK